MLDFEKRTLEEAQYIVKTQKTVRESAKHFNVSKSTLHSDLKNRLPKINYELYLKVEKILQFHFEQKHLRGGKATKIKWENLKRNAIK